MTDEVSPEPLDAFAEAVREARGAQGLTQRALAEVVGLSQNAVARWEIGESAPGTPASVFHLEGVLDLEPGSLSIHLGYLPVGANLCGVELAIRSDSDLDAPMKAALLTFYHSAVGRRQC